MKKIFTIESFAIATVILFGGASIASANQYVPAPINDNRCPTTSTLTIPEAWALINYLQLSQAQQNAIFSNANLYLNNPPQYTLDYSSYKQMYICLQSGFVSNVPSNVTIPGLFASNSTGIISYYEASTDPYANYPTVDNSNTPNWGPNYGVGKTDPATTTTTTSYTVSVNYDHFTSEAAQYGYASVYTTTGTKSVQVSLVQLPAGSSLTASQAIAQLSALGYRPATLSEIYSLKAADPSAVNGNTVALGTNLGSSYGYPTGVGYGASGLGHNTGPFGTNVWIFAAVATNPGTAGTVTGVFTPIVSATSTVVTSAGTPPSVSSIVAYTVPVNYDHFTSEAAQYGYTSVYTNTGTKTVSITIVKFTGSSSATASQAIAQLSALGYRPATLSEIYSLKAADPSAVNANVVALGTNLGRTYGYPTGYGTGSAGLGLNPGPFSESQWSFAAVQN
ncbi:MAG: hypothetical protein P4L61_03510 [Candidatus Pacebacteria bacterium]|nr:hypothetical protein [Candidatus Paceibacterota bacterium]